MSAFGLRPYWRCPPCWDPSGGVLCGLLAAVLMTGAFAGNGAAKLSSEKIAFKMFRVDMVDSRRNERSYQRDLRIILAGPGLNFLLAALCLPVYLLLPYQWLGMFFSANLLVGFFNIQPIATLDGGAAVCNFIRKAGRKESVFLGQLFFLRYISPLGRSWLLDPA